LTHGKAFGCGKPVALDSNRRSMRLTASKAIGDRHCILAALCIDGDVGEGDWGSQVSSYN
jgi:hypothetical protein